MSVAMTRMGYRRGLSTIGVPTVVVVGSKDRLTVPARGRALVAAIPGARLEVLDGIGHMLPLEAPDVLAREIAGLSMSSGATESVV